MKMTEYLPPELNPSSTLTWHRSVGGHRDSIRDDHCLRETGKCCSTYRFGSSVLSYALGQAKRE